MRINELKLYGFKSFADKTTIRFEDDFIGIVGPNGSGKSNIIDAIRWVFGEQSSKSLRGNNSIDVIFGGTQTRKKMNYAEVTLVLDNKEKYLPLDYNEVSITRRLYRSGDSEYLLNGIECRLKDITELIMDTGMGKNSFSIISQGKIEEITTSKPETRRQTIEEVAGVLKYKKRKETALRKLSKTQDNLNQVDIVLSEMSDRLVPLKRQSEKANRFIDYKKQLEEFEITLLAKRIEFNHEHVEGYSKILNQLEFEDVTCNNKLSKLETDILILSEQIHEESLNINKLVNKIAIEQSEFHELDSQYRVLQERRNNIAKDDISKLIINTEKIIFESKKNKTIHDKEMDIIVRECNEKQSQYNTLYNEYNELKRNKFNLANKLDDFNQQAGATKYPYATRILLDNDNFMVDVVKDLYTTEKKYATAVSVALGGRANELVMETTAEVKKAVTYIRNNKSGRATFLPLDNIREFKIDENIIKKARVHPGYIGLAIDLLESDSKYSKVFNNIVGTVIITDNIDSANNVSKLLGNRYRIVTLDGEVVNTSGSITGGFLKDNNKLVLKSEITKLEESIIKVNDRIENISSDMIIFDESHRQLSFKVSVKKELIDKLNRDINTKTYELNDLLSQTNNSDSNNINDIQDSIEQIQNNIVELTKVKDEHTNTHDKLINQKEVNQLELKNTNEEIRILGKKVKDNSVNLSKMEISIENDLSILSEEYSLSYEMALKNAKSNIDINKYETSVISLKRSIKELGPVNTDSIEEYVEISERYNYIDVQKKDLDSAKGKLEEIINKLDTHVISQFSDTYTKLRDEFQTVFTELFGGGQADLVLTDPDDILNTGIEIVAQPPGKKLQTISLLSGGEKALTAIALLFAILRVRTVPFAILDEVEAALDETNVKRYARYLKIFSEYTQFLVITHRQGTMEIVDKLYGITMAEKGVSSVVGVKMTQEGSKIDV